MKSSIVIGPIKTSKRDNQRHILIQDRLSKMKTGNYFEISGISSKQEANNLRSQLQYFSKKKGITISTSMPNSNTLMVQRVKSETKSPVGV